MSRRSKVETNHDLRAGADENLAEAALGANFMRCSICATMSMTSPPPGCPKALANDRPRLPTPPLPALQGNPRNTENTANPKAKLQPYTLAACRRCLTLEMLDQTLRPTLGDMLLDEDTWNTATNSSPEMKAWVDGIQTTARLQGAAEITADCTAARAWVAASAQRHPELTP
jgi:hypothetical protein